MSADAVAELLRRWSDARGQGRTITPEELCRDRPELLPELLRHLKEEPLATAPPGAIPPPSLRRVGDYDLLEEIGRGAMGVVYRARDTHLGRTVALKMILPEELAAGRRKRFVAEAETVARLNHPHIAAVHAAGEQDGRPWFAMELASGGNLEQRLDGRPVDPRDAAALVKLLARAVHAAHKAGVIHRDLKPANILLADPVGDPALDSAWGCPRVSDFGLARRLDAGSLTQPNQLMGTPAYMAPEQAEGRSGDVGPATDVYALGAILYQLLTGRPPFESEGLYALLEQIVRRPPVPPAERNPAVPADLNAVCLRCLAKRPADRFGSAADLADALQRCLDGPETLPVRGVSGPSRPPARRRMLAAPALLVLLAAGVASAIFLWPQSPLRAEMIVKVYSPSVGANPGKPWLALDAPGATPIRPGESFRVEVALNRPAHVYLILLSSQGEVVPLYPWNDNEIRVKALDAPGGKRVQRVASPPAGDKDEGWEMDEQPGLETILLMARDRPLDRSDRLREWIGEVPSAGQAPLGDEREAAILSLTRGGEVEELLSLHRGIKSRASAVDDPIARVMRRLKEHFEVVQAARLAHAGP